MENTAIFSKEFPLDILIAADNPHAQATTKGILINLGYQPEVAVNGQEMMSMTSTKSYDVILVDIQMPEAEGMLVARQRDRQARRPLIIAMTGHALQDFRQNCLKERMDSFINNPPDPKELTLQLKACSVLTGHRSIRVD
ncbi:MAG TPA: response regulator [Puia sp.]|jgi:CheY-like chemotaxis protein|nr:response regulator [Puia sp.]